MAVNVLVTEAMLYSVSAVAGALDWTSLAPSPVA